MKKGSGSGSPPIPPPDTDPRTPKMALFDPPGGGPKIAILGALRCRVRGGWGGSAHYPDPTAQSASASSARRPPRAAGPFRRQPAPSEAHPGQKRGIFVFCCLLAVGVERGLSEAGCRSVPAGRWPSACRRGLQASPILRGSPTEGGRRLSEPAYPGRGVPLATHPLRSARCDTPLGVRVWLSQTAPRSHATPPCAWLPPFALREVLFRSATYPPLRRRGAMGPVAALLPNAPGFQPNARCAWCRTGTQLG